MPNIVVIGAGILGSSIAANLAQKDCRVTVLEAAQRPAEGATAKSWAWLNANRKTPTHYAGNIHHTLLGSPKQLDWATFAFGPLMCTRLGWPSCLFRNRIAN